MPHYDIDSSSSEICTLPGSTDASASGGDSNNSQPDTPKPECKQKTSDGYDYQNVPIVEIDDLDIANLDTSIEVNEILRRS